MAAASMNMSAYSKYIILDIRHNPGGTVNGPFYSRIFTTQAKHLSERFCKDRKHGKQNGYAYTPVNTCPMQKVYILTGREL